MLVVEKSEDRGLRIDRRDSREGALGAAHDEQVVMAESDPHVRRALRVGGVHPASVSASQPCVFPAWHGVWISLTHGRRDAHVLGCRSLLIHGDPCAYS